MKKQSDLGLHCLSRRFRRQLVFEILEHLRFFIFSQVQITEDVRQYLRKPTFDNWQWDEPEMLVLLQQMYIDLGFVTKFKIEVSQFITSSDTL